MRKLSRPQKPENFDTVVSNFTLKYPPATSYSSEGKRWEAFKRKKKKLRNKIQQALYDNQHGLCSFCECSLKEDKKEIEHFVPKSRTTSTEDWTLNFSNLSMSCRGGAGDDDHCGHLKGDMNPHGLILSPYELPEDSIFAFKKVDNHLRIVPDKKKCKEHNIPTALAQSTIDNLGLNSNTLAQSRYEIWNGIEEQILDAEDLLLVEQQDEYETIIHDNLEAVENILPSYISTRTWGLRKELPEMFAG